jgi:hypothetical protein
MLNYVYAQTPIYYENCETTGYNWRATFSGPNTSYITGYSSNLDLPANSPFFFSFNTSIIHQGAGSAGSGPERVIISLPAVNLNPNIANCFKMKFASIGLNPSLNSGAGVDNQDNLRLNVSYNGSSTFSPEIQVNGGSNNVWPYNTTNNIYRTAQGSLSNYAQVIGSEYSSLTLELPLGTYQVAFEIDLGLNAAGETWLIDDMEIVGSCYSPLPIELLYFIGNQIDDSVYLNWTTASETNNDYFTLYESNDLVKIDEIVKINGFGNSNFPIEYKYIDLSPAKYYRLCQTDYDGRSECFDWISIMNFKKDSESYRIYDVFGRRSSIDHDGVLIFVDDKGKAKKIIIKK